MSEQIDEQEYNAVPKWMTIEYVQNVLRKYLKDDKLSVLKIACRPATALGENYASVMLRMFVDYSSGEIGEKHNITFLVKTTYQSDDPVSDLFKPYGIYTREMDMYELILPKLSELMREIGSTEKLFANTMHVDRANSSIIFEDLSLENYVTANRIERYDMEHTLQALRKLAMFHATSAVLNERSPGIFSNNFDRGFFNRHTDVYKLIHFSILKALIRYVEKEPKLKLKYHKKLVMLLKNHMENGARVYDVREEDFMTLTHGDYWSTNIMLRYDNNKRPQDVILIDFQFSTWCSATLDLHYLFNSSLREELRMHHQEELVQYYYNIMTDTLRQLKYKGHIPTLQKFNLEFQERYYMAVFTSFVFQPVMIYNGTEKSTVSNIISQDETGMRLKDSYFENEAVQKYVHSLLPFFDRKGLFDPMD